MLRVKPGRNLLYRRWCNFTHVWRVRMELIYWQGCCSALFVDLALLSGAHRNPRRKCNEKSALRPGSSVVERGPEKAGVGGSIPSLATIIQFQSIPSHTKNPVIPYYSMLLFPTASRAGS